MSIHRKVQLNERLCVETLEKFIKNLRNIRFD